MSDPLWRPVVPNGRVLLAAMRLNPESLSKKQVTVPATAWRALLSILVSALPFDEEFYAATYPDIDEARRRGEIPDLRMHFVENGYFEGRLGSAPRVDEAFYLARYRDVALAIAAGQFDSAREHYIKVGAAEGRAASEHDLEALHVWINLLRRGY